MSKEAMKLALEALMREMKYVLCCINIDKVPFDGDDFHEALRLGEEALAKQEQHTLSSRVNDVRVHIEHGKQHDEAMKRIKAKQEQGEPVAWCRYEDGMWVYYETKAWDDLQPLYTTPQQRTWVGLTDEEIQDLMDVVDHYNFPEDLIVYTQAKLREKNT